MTIRFVALFVITLAASALARGIHGEFTPTSPTWVRGAPVPSTQVDTGCALDLTGWQAEWESPYAMYPIAVVDREPIEIWTDITATEYDPVLYLYCDPFDAADPMRGAIAYDDDDGGQSMARIALHDDVRLEPGLVYWVMIAWYDSLLAGRYLIRLSDNVVPATVAAARRSWGELKALSVEPSPSGICR